MTPTAAYDAIADWYENEFFPATDVADPLGIRRALNTLLGRGDGGCLEVGCGTGAYAAQVWQLGWRPVGVDLSAGMLAYAKRRLPVAQGDATRLPVRDVRWRPPSR